MAMPDPIDHAAECPAQDTGKPPALMFRFDPNRDVSTVRLHVWEFCTGCTRTVHYQEERIAWRTFHRTWRARAAVWVATWEHRHGLGGRTPD
jgi:predicted Fe-S protein YdhL (DUF1289 family)